MSYSVNPLNFKSLKIGTPAEQQSFLSQLGQLLSEITNNLGSATFIAEELSSSALLSGGSLNNKSKAFGSVGTNQTFDATRAASVNITQPGATWVQAGNIPQT